MSKKRFLAVSFLLLFIFPMMFSSYVASEIANIPYEINPTSTFNPIVTPLIGDDTNDNKIHDHLEELVANGLSTAYYTTIMTFDRPVDSEIIEQINNLGGEVLTTWEVIYGAAVSIRADRVNSLSSVSDLTLVTENCKSHRLLSTSVPQINVRPYVWDLGFEGDPTQAIAILDTGIDDTHADLAGKVVYWHDYVGHSASSSSDEYGVTIDWDGHGTHCSSIATGTGVASGTAATVEESGTYGIEASRAVGAGYYYFAEIESSGQTDFIIQWNDKSGNSNSDTMYFIFDSDNDGDLGDESTVSIDYIQTPYTVDLGVLSAGKYAYTISPGEDLGELSIQYTFSRPASSPSDSYNKYRGVAPDCNLVGLKVLDDTGSGFGTDLIDAMNWIYLNGDDPAYNITVVSMSLGFEAQYSNIDTAVNNLVSAGYVVVVAAGNSFYDGYPIGSPGTAAKAITVGAIDDVDKIAIYSSNGATAVKPDIVAPGGAYRYGRSTDEDTHPIVAADTNFKDEVYVTDSDTYYWETEMTTDSYIALQGTSMATPHVAGLAALIINALGVEWTHTEADVLYLKNLLCGTATEVRYGEELLTWHNEPDLNRGARDKVEGFGKVHADAAIDAFLSEYLNGTEEIGTLGSDPTDAQSWARKVELVGGIEFTAGIEIAGPADYDLYLYDPSEDMTTSVGYLVKSTTSGDGIPENIAFTPVSDMTAYLVVKRVSGSGDFTLMSTATSTGTPTGFTWPFSIPIFVWIVLGTMGLSSVIIFTKRRK